MVRRFGVAKLTFWGLEGCNLELVSSESDVKQRQPQAKGLARPSCFGGYYFSKFWTRIPFTRTHDLAIHYN